MDMNIEASHVVEVSTAPSSSPKKLTVPLIGLERFPTQQEIEGQDVRNRRPVRPIDRQRMRPWLMELLDMGNVFGLRWTNRHLGIFQISWKHASRLGWNLETDGDVFERWARHTGIYKEGDPPEPKRWKANFRCALHSLTDVLELTNAVERRGRNACRTYQFLQNNNTSSTKSKPKKQKEEVKVPRAILPLMTLTTPAPGPEILDLPESTSSDELLSETESEGSQKDKVIVQRLEAKSHDAGEDFILYHDHDYSAGPLKTQKTIYLRQGVGSIVLQKEVHGAPEDGEDLKSHLLSNLDQLASAAVDSETITVQRSPVSGLHDLGQVSRSETAKAVYNLTFDESRDRTDYNFKNLLPRLRARIKESGGLVRKRKGSNFEIDSSELELVEHNGNIKKDKLEKDIKVQSPPSPPMTRRRSGSPKKAVKIVSKSKRSRKESDESTSDSTEPLMSSCLLLLEAATRLDNAEKNGSASGRTSKTNKRGVTPSANSLAVGRRRTSSRVIRSEKHLQEEEVRSGDKVDDDDENLLEGSMEIIIQSNDTAEVSPEMIIEEEVLPEDAVQVIYEVEEDQLHHSAINDAEPIEELDETAQYHDLLRAALENIGSELEVTTVESTEPSSMPKEMAIMRRKKDSDRLSSQNNVELIGQNEASSFPKGLFSGSEIITDNQHPLSIVRKRIKGKNKGSPKDNIYYVDIHTDDGSICVKQSDGNDMDEKEPVLSQATNSLVKNSIGIQQTVIQRELPVLNPPPQKFQPQNSTSTTFLSSSGTNTPQIFIAATQNASGQQILLPVSSGGLKARCNTSAEQNIIQVSSAQGKHIAGQGNSFISVAPQGKTLLFKPDTSSKGQGTTLIPLMNPVASSNLSPNFKISTLPIVSKVKPAVSISASVNTPRVQEKTVMNTNSVVPIKFVPKASAQLSNTAKQVPIATSTSGTKTWILQPQIPASELHGSKTTTVRISPVVNIGGQATISGMASGEEENDKSIFPSSTLSSISVLTKSSNSSVMNNNTLVDTKSAELDLPAQVIFDHVKGSILQLPLGQISVSQSSDLPTTSLYNLSISSSQQSVVSSPPCNTASDLLSLPSQTVSSQVPIKTEMEELETFGSLSNEHEVAATVAVSDTPFSSPSLTGIQNTITVIKQEVEDGTIKEIETTEENTPDLVAVSDAAFSCPSSLSGLQDSITLIKSEVEEGTVKEIDTCVENITGLSLQSSSEFLSPQITEMLQGSVGKVSTYQIIEPLTDSSSTINVIVKSEDGDQQFITIQDEQSIVSTTQTVSTENVHPVAEVNTTAEIESAITESNKKDNGQEVCYSVTSKEEEIISHHPHDPIHMDPRTPLAIGEIPLFAASKGDSD